MKDAHIRAALKQRLSAVYGNNPDTLIVEELGLRHGISRIDVAVISGSLHGFELKSDRDRLDRLSRQAEHYNAIFDLMTLVVGPRLKTRAIEMIPDWWGIEFAEMGGDGLAGLVTVREARENPSLDPLAIAKLLWREEALALLIELGQSRGLFSKPRAYLYERLAEASDLGFLRHRVRDRLRNRSAFRWGQPPVKRP